MSVEKTEFEKYQAIHNLCNPDEPLKGWINEVNFINIYTENWESISEALPIIYQLIVDNNINDICNESNEEEREYICKGIADSFFENDIKGCFEYLYSYVEWYLQMLDNYSKQVC